MILMLKSHLYTLRFQGHFIEVQVTDGALYRTKIHCYFLDQTRVIRPLSDEKNYHIFYQMLAGLSHDERGNAINYLTTDTTAQINKKLFF